MGAGVVAWATAFERTAVMTHERSRVLEVAVGLALGAGIYGALLHTLRIEEARDIMKRLFSIVPAMAGMSTPSLTKWP